MNPQMSGQYILYFLLAMFGHAGGLGTLRVVLSNKTTGKSLSLSKLPLWISDPMLQCWDKPTEIQLPVHVPGRSEQLQHVSRRARDAPKNLSTIYNHLQVEYEVASIFPSHFIS